MHRKTFFIFVFCFIFSVSILQAQDHRSKVAISGLAGVSFPVGNFASPDPSKGNAKKGYTFGSSLEYFFKKKVSLGINLMYNSFDDKDTSSIKNRITSYGLVGRYVLNNHPEVDYYLRFGLGLAKFTKKGTGPDRSYDLKTSITVGLGFSYKLTSSISLLGETVYHQVLEENAKYSLGGVKQAALGYNLQHFGIYTGLVFYIKTKQPESSY